MTVPEPLDINKANAGRMLWLGRGTEVRGLKRSIGYSSVAKVGWLMSGIPKHPCEELSLVINSKVPGL